MSQSPQRRGRFPVWFIVFGIIGGAYLLFMCAGIADKDLSNARPAEAVGLIFLGIIALLLTIILIRQKR